MTRRLVQEPAGPVPAAIAALVARLLALPLSRQAPIQAAFAGMIDLAERAERRPPRKRVPKVPAGPVWFSMRKE